MVIYCAFHKHADSEVQKLTDDCVFRCRQSSQRTSKETKLYFNGFKRSWPVICDWWISIRFLCFCVSRFVACDHNYDWRQRKTQLWRRLLNFRVRMFVKSAVSCFIIFYCISTALLSWHTDWIFDWIIRLRAVVKVYSHYCFIVSLPITAVSSRSSPFAG